MHVWSFCYIYIIINNVSAFKQPLTDMVYLALVNVLAWMYSPDPSGVHDHAASVSML